MIQLFSTLILLMHRLRPLLTYCVARFFPAYAFLPGTIGLLGRISAISRPPCKAAWEARRSSRWVRRGTSEFRSAGDNLGESWDVSVTNPWDDLDSSDRWERQWKEGEKEKRKSSFLTSMGDWDSGRSSGLETEVAMPVAVVSFDLDDTLWSTKGVIDQANNALQEHMLREHPELAKKFVIADLMKEVWKERLVEDPKLDAAPVNLTELRKAGLTRACELSETDPSAVVESCFEVWRKERHNVEPHLFPGALETLTGLRDRGVRLVAITNGNAQTDDIPCLKDLFEFCVMAEQVGERKPEAGPFREAVRRAGYPSEQHVGGEWVHVGDDWTSDCVGAKTMRMRTVLVRVPGKLAIGEKVYDNDDEEDVDLPVQDEEDREDYPVLDKEPEKIGKIGAAWRIAEEREKDRKKAIKRAERLGLTIHGDFDVAAGTAGMNAEKSEAASGSITPNISSPKGAKKKSAKPETLDSDAYGEEMAAMAMGADFSVLQGPGKAMSMGTKGYLADMIIKDFMDVSLDNIAEVVTLVDNWNDQYALSPKWRDGDRLSVASAAAKREPATSSTASPGRAREDGSKFCTNCGAKIPATAKFCSECGAKQETV